MAYDNNDFNKRPPLESRVESETQYEKRQERQNRTGLIILCVAVVAIAAGFIATLDNRTTATMVPGSVVSTADTGTTEATIAPAAGTSAANGVPTNTSPESAINTTAASGNTTGTGVNSVPEVTPAPTTTTTTTTATSDTTTSAPVTENPKIYTSEDTCRSASNGACRTTSGGWTSVNPAPERTAIPEAVAPSAGSTPTNDTTNNGSSED